jgi:hypothetical protein
VFGDLPIKKKRKLFKNKKTFQTRHKLDTRALKLKNQNRILFFFTLFVSHKFVFSIKFQRIDHILKGGFFIFISRPGIDIHE